MMKMMKKFYGLLTAMTAMVIILNIRTVVTYGATDSSFDSFVHALTAAEENHISKIDCLDYNLTGDEIAYAVALVELNNPYLYGVNEFEYSYSGSKIKSVTLSYNYNIQEYASQRKVIEAAIDEIVAKTEGMSNPEKVQTVYTYLAENYTYDNTLSTREYNVYTLFSEGRGMCKTLNGAFKLIMDELDIPCRVVTNVTSYKQDLHSLSNHVWDEVYVSEGWVKADVTAKQKSLF